MAYLTTQRKQDIKKELDVFLALLDTKTDTTYAALMSVWERVEYQMAKTEVQNRTYEQQAQEMLLVGLQKLLKISGMQKGKFAQLLGLRADQFSSVLAGRRKVDFTRLAIAGNNIGYKLNIKGLEIYWTT